MSSTLNQEAVSQRVANHYNDDEQFLKYFSFLMDFYFHRFGHYIRAKEERNDFQNSFIEYMKNVIETGYYMGDQFLSHDETNIPDDFLIRPEGLIQELIIQPLDEATNGFDQAITTDVTGTYEAALIDQHKNVATDIFQARSELAYFGVWLAFKDERDNRNIHEVEEPEGDMIGYLHRIDDLFHTDPKKYFHCLTKNETSETWQLTPSNKMDNQQMNLGLLIIQHIPKERLSKLNDLLPSLIDQETNRSELKETILINLKFHHSIRPKEQIIISQQLQEKVSDYEH
ncbi:hypothetical protein [Salipaludibacillus sp. CF4.18]|uniref:hypothetical protein n=1 Tax=Salipaludibacillus sp. CF4.18 TaxID=3373081 RepID=UPI003EE8160C